MSKRKQGTLGFIRSAGVENPDPPPPPQGAYQYIQDAFRPTWGRRSHWKEPWRSYLDTTPAIDVLNGLGININAKQTQVAYVAQLLGNMGFRRARIEPGWNSLSYADPTKFTANGLSMLTTQVNACKDNGLRPLILLNGNHGDPCPSTQVLGLKLTEAAVIGATSIKIEPAGLASIVKGKTGITANGVRCFYLFRDYDEDGTVYLSQPLKAELKLGALASVFTLKYAPFHAVTIAGAPNPSFEETMLGWLGYAKTVASKVKDLLGSEEFDVEVWNELSFGSNFLGINNYYEPDLEASAPNGLTSIWGRTLAYLRDPANGVPNIGIDNGFVNQGNGIMGGPGATANSRHPYPGRQSYPTFDTKEDANGNVFQSGSLVEDAKGKTAVTSNAKGKTVPLFVPTYRAWFPEYPLCYLQTESKVLDLAPYQSYVPNNSHGEPHGRNSVAGKEPSPKDASGGLAPSGYATPVIGQIPTRLWITETNIGSWAQGVPGVSAAEKRHLSTKVILRSIICYLTKGLQALYFYASGTGAADDLAIVDYAFFEAISKGSYPGDAVGGETMLSVGRLTGALAGATQLTKPATVTLDDLLDYAGNIQFKGSEAFPGYSFPDKANKDCFFFAPMQVNDSRRFVCSAYVMTKDVAHEYSPSGGITRLDLPEEKYRMTIGGVKGTGAVVSALDPVTGASVPVTTIEAGANKLVVEMKVTDYPRLLTIQET